MVKIAQCNVQTTCMESCVQKDVIAKQTKFAIMWMDAKVFLKFHFNYLNASVKIITSFRNK